MKKVLTLIVALMAVLPLSAQTKEERKAAEQAAYTAALDAINAKAFVLVPTTYQDSDGEMFDNVDNANFLSAEGENFFAQGKFVCGNDYTNILSATDYTVNVDKKGNVKIKLIVTGRMMRGTYNITMRKGNNMADVIFNQPGQTTRRFSGPIVPLAGANYQKRSNAM